MSSLLSPYFIFLLQPGTYDTLVILGEYNGSKIYNHTCAEMDTFQGENVPVTLTG
jgi:hypothetical protein